MNTTTTTTVRFQEAKELAATFLAASPMACEVSYQVLEGGTEFTVWIDRTGTVRAASRYDSMGRDKFPHLPNISK